MPIQESNEMNEDDLLKETIRKEMGHLIHTITEKHGIVGLNRSILDILFNSCRIIIRREESIPIAIDMILEALEQALVDKDDSYRNIRFVYKTVH